MKTIVILISVVVAMLCQHAHADLTVRAGGPEV